MLRKIGICCLASFFICGIARGQASNQPWQIDPTLQHEIGTVIRIVDALRTGKTRADISKDFKTEGGLSSLQWNHYVYKRCPYIKIDVTFESDPKEIMTKEAAADKIATVSKPYLEFSVMD